MKLKTVSKVLLHQQVAEVLRAQIAHCRPGDRLDSENRLAAQMGVSPVTMRSALLLLAKEGLIERRQGSGTVILDPAGRRHVGILVELDICHPRVSHFYVRMSHQVRESLAAQGVAARLYVGNVLPGSHIQSATCLDFLRAVEEDRLCGVIGIASTPRDGWYEALVPRGVPVVGSPDTYPFGVGFQPERIVSEAVQRLVEAGCKRPALLFYEGPTVVSDSRSAFIKAMAQHGLAPVPRHIASAGAPGNAGAAWEAFRELWLAPGLRPDGLVIADDTLFHDAALAILEARVRIPEDLKIVTHSTRGRETFYPFPVTALETDPELLAEAAVEMFLTLRRGGNAVPQHRFLPHETVEYLSPGAASTARPLPSVASTSN